MNINKLTDIKFPYRSQERRTPGLHLSDVIKYRREVELNEIFPDDDDLEPDELRDANLQRELGFIWEDELSLAFGWPFTVEFRDEQLDGLWLNPDHRFSPVKDRIDEFKLTQKRKPPHEIPYWMWQIKAYCYRLGRQKGRFWVLYVHGLGQWRPVPEFHCWEYEFTDDELIENWQEILKYKEAVINSQSQI